MVTLKDAVLARGVAMDSATIRSVKDIIIDREEFAVPIPSEFPVWIVFKFESEPGTVFPIAAEVKSSMGRPIYFDSGRLEAPVSGKGEFAIPVAIPALEVGPMRVSLLFNGQEVWKQTIFFALA